HLVSFLAAHCFVLVLLMFVDTVVDQPPQTGTNFTLGNLVINGVVQSPAGNVAPNFVTNIGVDTKGDLIPNLGPGPRFSDFASHHPRGRASGQTPFCG